MVRKISKKKKTPKKGAGQKKLLVYPIPGEGKKGPSQTEFYGYEFVLLIDAVSRQAQQIGGAIEPPADLYQNNPLHSSALEEALRRGICHYEWSWELPHKRALYQTTCIALPEPGGTPRSVLSFSRDITHSAAAYLEGTSFQENAAPRTFAQILLATREAEKKAISKALHDEIGSSAVMLTALISLVGASIRAGKKTQALQDLKQLDTQMKESIERMKRVVVSLRPPSLENKGGLGGAVRDLLENIGALHHIRYTFDYDAVDEQIQLSDNVKILLYRIVQEALTNTVKHARAKRVRVCLKQAGPRIRLAVSDDGIGFNPSQQRSVEHIGLLAMKDSVELLEGTISIKSAPGKGTRIEVSCPCVVYGGKIK